LCILLPGTATWYFGTLTCYWVLVFDVFFFFSFFLNFFNTIFRSSANVLAYIDAINQTNDNVDADRRKYAGTVVHGALASLKDFKYKGPFDEKITLRLDQILTSCLNSKYAPKQLVEILRSDEQWVANEVAGNENLMTIRSKIPGECGYLAIGL
jgi:hypothetical protein